MLEEVKTHLSETQVLLLYLLLNFEKVCKAANITWYASGGTCLGAVRHKGFIPWDDDIDIDMPRTSYNTFVEKSKEMLPETIVLRTRETDPFYCQEYIKMCYKDEKQTYSDIDLDIFFYDDTNPQRIVFRATQNFLINWLYYIKEYKVSRDGKGKAYVPKNAVKKLILNAFSHFSYELIDSSLLEVMTAEKHDTEYWVDWGAAHNYKIATFEKAKMGAPRVIPFEMAEVYVANDTDYFLNRLYGVNYMEIPPVEKRKSHNVSMPCNSMIDIDTIQAIISDIRNWPKL